MSQSDFVTRGQALVSAGQYQEAVKVCRLGLLGRPTTVEGRVVLGQALLALKRYDEVLAEMRVALELDHGSTPAQVLKGEALLRKGDPHGALEVLQRARTLSPADPKIAGLLSEVQHAMGRPAVTAIHPAVGFVGGTESTKHYPRPTEGTADQDLGEDLGDTVGYPRPASLAVPQAKPKPVRPAAVSAPARGDRSGTVEVDPDIDGVELDDDFGDVAAPPRLGRAAGQDARKPGQVASRSAPAPGKPASSAGRSSLGQQRPVKPLQKADISSIELDDDEVMDVEETSAHQPARKPEPARKPGPATAVRNAIKLPSGPLDAYPAPAANRPAEPPAALAPPAHLAQMLANAPRMTQMGPPPPLPQPPPPPPRHNPLGGAPTVVSALPPPPLQFAQPMPYSPAAARPTEIGPAQQPTAAADPRRPNMFGYESAASIDPASLSGVKGPRTGQRRARPRFQLVIWILIGGLVIGGGVFAGFQIRAIRLRKQIGERRDEAVALAKGDTWKGWIGARDRLAGIAQASSTPDNLATLARTRALVAFEFGDGVADARAAVEGLAGQPGLDADLAAAYLALAVSDAKAARSAADRATAGSPTDAAAQYVSGQAALLAGDTAEAIKNLTKAFERDGRPIYGVGLAHAYAEASQWKDALTTLDKATAAWRTATAADQSSSPDYPAAVIERGMVLAVSGQITQGGPLGNEVRGKLQKVVSEGQKSLADQAGGVSPAQVAFADLALAQVDFARNDLTAAQADVRAALAVHYDEQRFAEQAVETLYMLGELGGARAAAEGALSGWPTSSRARIGMAQILLAQGKPADALDIISKTSGINELAGALSVRGQIELTLGNLDEARTDFEAALKRSKNFEPALAGRLWVHVAEGSVGEAIARIEKLEPPFNPSVASPQLATVYAAVLRAQQDPGLRDKARAILERVVAGPPGVDVPRAQLELARIYRDIGDIRSARTAYGEASRRGNDDAKLEGALLQIEDRDPSGGRDTLDELIKNAGDTPSSALLLHGARARMLAGDHKGAEALLERVDKMTKVTRWMLDRERGRLALRKGDYAGATTALARALETCGDDAETFLLAADVVAADDKQVRLGDRVKQLAPKQLKSRPEAQIVAGKLLLSNGDEALKAYETARIALEVEKASPRRLAQAHLGRAIAAYNKQDDPAANDALDAALASDPSLYAAYLYAADIAKEKDPKQALGLAQKAVQYNPDLVDGHLMVGTLAARLGNRKLLAETITRVGDLAPNSDALRQLRGL